jgi:Cu/Ag efflux pump CusA
MIGSAVASILRLRALVVVVALIVLAVGLTTLRKMPVDVFPEILPVTVTVQTEALGLSAEEIEQLVTVPIEADLLTGTPWVEVMRSQSVPGLSSIELEFKPGTNPMHARQVVQERLTQAHALPNVSKPPHMLQPLSSTNRLMLVGLSSKNQSLIEMSVLARWTIRPRLLGVQGVANVSVWGQRERQLQVRVDPERLRDNKVSLIQVIKTAGNALWYSPLSFLEASVAGTGGFVETPNQRIGVRHVLPISKASDMARLPIEGSNLRLDQVADLVEDHQPLIGDGMNAGQNGLLLVVEKLPGANTLEVTNDVLAALEALKPGLGGIEFDTNVYHPARYIRNAMGNVGGALVLALALVVLLLIAFTGDWRSAVVGLVTLPVSLVSAALVLYFTGATMNAMVIAGLVIAVGLVIDDSIMFTQNLLRRLRAGNGLSNERVVLDASADARRGHVFVAMIVLLAALPLVFLAAGPATFVKPLVAAYALAVLASGLVSATVAPALAYMLLGKHPHAPSESPLGSALRGAATLLSTGARGPAIAVAVLATVAGIAMLPMLRVPAAPTFKEHDLLVHFDAQPGTSHAEMSRVMERASAELRGVAGVKSVGGHVGRAILADQVVGMHSGDLWVSVDPKANYQQTVAKVNEIVQGYPGIDGDVMTFLTERFGEYLTKVDEPIVVRLYGQRLDVLQREADKVMESIRGVRGISDPRMHYEPSEPVVEIEVDLERAKAFAVKPGDVRRSASALLSGIEVGNLFEEQKLFEVVVWGEADVRHSVEAIRDLLVDRPEGGHVRLGDVADVRIVNSPDLIQRENVARYLDVVADVNGRSVKEVSAEVESRLHAMSFPIEYHAELKGGYDQQQAAKTQLWIVTIAAVLGIGFLLHAALGSASLAGGVMLTLPLALAGSVIGAFLTGGNLSVGAFAGFLAVLGITIRQGVALIDRCMTLRRNGADFGPALVAQAVSDRASSGLCTVLLTAAAMLPFALQGSKPGLEVLGPMAWVILLGLTTSAVHTLSVVPALYLALGAKAAAHDTDDLEDVDIQGQPQLQRS